MKKKLFSIAAMAVVLSLVSCKSSSSFEKDVRKKDDYMCKVHKLSRKATN